MKYIIKILILMVWMGDAIGWNSFDVYPPIQILYHPVSTKNEKAQEAFNQGLLGIYAFNYEGAYEKFQESAKIDPHLAMAYWGMALALDEKYSPYPTAKQAEKIYELGQKAQELSRNSTASEKAYINAFSKRLSKDPKVKRKELRKAYEIEMKKVSLRFPDDPDALTLYAESMMDLLDWELWSHDKSPKGNALEIISVLESAIAKVPYHVGANHYYIHAIENSPHPEYGLMHAERLDQLAFLFDEWSHLLHTPSHIYMKVGYYNKAVEDGKRAIKADKEYAKTHNNSDYAIHGLTHNLSFLIMAYLWSESYENALESASFMAESVKPHIKEMPGYQYHTLYLPEVYLYFNHFDEILEMKEPPKEWKVAHTYWHFTRGLAYSRLDNVIQAEKEKEAFLQERLSLEKEKYYEKETFKIAEHVLESAIAKAKGQKETTLEELKKAISIQDSIDFLDWYEPLRGTLGQELLEWERYQEAEEVFRKELSRFPLNCKLLKGLSASLKGQGKEYYWSNREAKTEHHAGGA